MSSRLPMGVATIYNAAVMAMPRSPLSSLSNVNINMRTLMRWLVLSSALVLSACETVPERGVPTPPGEPDRTETAIKAEAAGDYVVAAREYERLAEAARPPQKQQYQLNAAEALIKGGWL